MPEEEHKPIGRPRSGVTTRLRFMGEPVSGFVKLTGRYPAQMAAELRELARERKEPLWGVLMLAAEAYLKALPQKERARLYRRAHPDAHQLAKGAREQYERNLELKARTR